MESWPVSNQWYVVTEYVVCYNLKFVISYIYLTDEEQVGGNYVKSVNIFYLNSKVIGMPTHCLYLLHRRNLVLL